MSQQQRCTPAAEEFVIPSRRAFLEALDLEQPELAAVKAALDAGNVEAATAAFAAHFRQREYDSPLLRDWGQTPRDPSYRSQTADDCLGGILPDGYNVYEVPETGIDWYDCPLFCLPRFPVFADLQEAAWHSGEARYVRFLIDHSLQYIAAYPIADFAGKHTHEGNRGHYLVGPPTWWCLLPNRLERWAHALHFVRSWPEVADEEIVAILMRMLQEIRYLMTQVQPEIDCAHNVGGFDIRVIAILCALFSDFPESREWRRRDADWLVQYIENGYYPDGLYKELTLGYSSSVVGQMQRSAGQFLEEPALAGKREMLLRIVTAMIGLAKPTGNIPCFGDAWGRPLAEVLYRPLVEWLDEPWLNCLLATGDWGGHQIIGPMSAKPGAKPPPIAWFKPEAAAAGPEPPFTTWPPPGQEAWGGYYSMRSDWSTEARYLMIDGGPWGTTHQHCDRLSFVLSAYGADFVTDPCNTLYANNEADARLSMCNAGFMHNTITVDGVDEFIAPPGWWATDRPLDNRWENAKGCVFFAGEFDFAPHCPVQWVRRVLFVGGEYWLIQDVLSGEPESVQVEQNFQFEEDIELALDGEQALATAPNGAQLLATPLAGELSAQIVLGEDEGHLTRATQYGPNSGKPYYFGHGRGWVARVGKSIIPAPALLRTGRLRLPAVITLALVPFAPEAAAVAPEIVAEARAESTLWHLPTTNGELRLLTSPTQFQLD